MLSRALKNLLFKKDVVDKGKQKPTNKIRATLG
jgi:hypothetical protein